MYYQLMSDWTDKCINQCWFAKPTSFRTVIRANDNSLTLWESPCSNSFLSSLSVSSDSQWGRLLYSGGGSGSTTSMELENNIPLRDRVFLTLLYLSRPGCACICLHVSARTVIWFSHLRDRIRGVRIHFFFFSPPRIRYICECYLAMMATSVFWSTT